MNIELIDNKEDGYCEEKISGKGLNCFSATRVFMNNDMYNYKTGLQVKGPNISFYI